jgi:ribose 5-phosphate isomerase B
MNKQKIKIHLATDHAGFSHKEDVKEWLTSEGFAVVDHGAKSFEPLDDYPDYISLAARAVSKSPRDRGVIFGGSGQGEAICANRFPYVRAAVYYGGELEIPKLSREHNDSNILSIGARFVPIEETKRAIWEWLMTESRGEEKYHRRNRKLDQKS